MSAQNRPGPGVLASLPDLALVSTTAIALGALPCGPGGGVFVTSHPSISTAR
jgi:hypothetical protein